MQAKAAGGERNGVFERLVCVVCACVYMYNFCTAVAPELSSTGACIVINSTSAREQINGGCTVMECMVKEDGMGEWRD